jgi:hypothetical protein
MLIPPVSRSRSNSRVRICAIDSLALHEPHGIVTMIVREDGDFPCAAQSAPASGNPAICESAWRRFKFEEPF